MFVGVSRYIHTILANAIETSSREVHRVVHSARAQYSSYSALQYGMQIRYNTYVHTPSIPNPDSRRDYTYRHGTVQSPCSAAKYSAEASR